jgi:hypothetical protein
MDEAGQPIGEVGAGMDAVQLTALDQGREHGPVCATFVVAGEPRIFSVEGDRRGAALGELEEPAAARGPTMGERDAASRPIRLDERLVGALAVGL